MYRFLFDQDITVPRSGWKTSEILISGELFGSVSSKSLRSSNILAYWVNDGGKIHPRNNVGLSPRPGEVEYFFKQTVYLNDVPYEFVLAKVLWLLPVEQKLKEYYGKPVEVWKYQLHEVSGPASFIPVQRIKCKYVAVPTKLRGRYVTVVLPRDRSYNI